jgi:hypothetical protein
MIVATPSFEARELRPGQLVMTAPVVDPALVEQAVDRLRATAAAHTTPRAQRRVAVATT